MWLLYSQSLQETLPPLVWILKPERGGGVRNYTPVLSEESTEPTPNPTGNWTDSGDNSWYTGHESDSSYEISTAAQLAGLANLVNAENDFKDKTIKLAGNIDLSEHYWTPIGDNTNNRFNGTFDGCNGIISGLIIDINTDQSGCTYGYVAAGLFGLNNGTIQNVIISSNSSISVSVLETSQEEYLEAYAGGICGRNNGSIINCTNLGEIKAKSSSCAYVGGITGENISKIQLCKNEGKISSEISQRYSDEDYYQMLYIGGIAGSNQATILDCINNGEVCSEILSDLKITSQINVGGITGYSNDGTVLNCCNYGTISAVLGVSNGSGNGSFAIVGGIVGWNNYIVSNCYNSGKISTQFVTDVDIDSTSYLYTGGIAGFNVGSISNCCNSGEVSADYLLNSIGSSNYHYSYTCAGGIAGYAEGTIEYCCNLGGAKIIASSSMSNYIEDYSYAYAGGIAAFNEAGSVEILNCYNEGVIESSSTSNSSRNHSSSGSYAYSGGIMAYLPPDGLIENCYSKIGTITAESTSNSHGAKNHKYFSNSYAGGICGRSIGIVSNCSNESNIKAINSVAISNSLSSSDRLFPSASAGGIIGAIDEGDNNPSKKPEKIMYCYNAGNVEAASNAYSASRVGGISGFTSDGGNILYSYNVGDISSSVFTMQSGSSSQPKNNSYLGGIVGMCGDSSDMISNCYNLGIVKMTINDNSCNSTIPYMGGICGINYGSIKNCYNVGDLSSDVAFEYVYVGGLVGDNHKIIQNCYGVGNLNEHIAAGSGMIGLVVGQNSSSSNVSNIFYLKTISTINAAGYSSVNLDDAVTGLDNSSEMIDLSLLSGSTDLNVSQDPKPWSPDIFDINEGYPILADTPIDLKEVSNPFKSPIYVTVNDESSQTDNFLTSYFVKNPYNYTLNANVQTSNTNLVNGNNLSYQWNSLNKSVISNISITSNNLIPKSDLGTYFVKIGFNGVGDKASNTYYYTSLTRTISEGEITITLDIGGETTTHFVSFGDKLTLKDPEKDGYEFDGWYLDAEFKTEYNLDAPIVSNTTLYAKFVKTIVFNVTPSDAIITVKDSDGSIVSPEPSAANSYKLTYGKEYTYTISKNGYKSQTIKFEVNNNTSADDFIIQLSSSSSGGIPVSYNVVYNANGGSGTLIDTNSPYHSGVTVLVLENNFTKDGYTFKNWNTKADGSETSYSAGDRFSINSNVTLYAQWEEVSTPPVVQKVTVTFYIGNEGVYKVIEVNKDSSLKDNFPVNPELDNGTFKEWNTKEDASGKAFTADSVVNEDTSVYAIWEKSSSSSNHSWWWIIIIIIILIIIIAAYYYYKKNQN